MSRTFRKAWRFVDQAELDDTPRYYANKMKCVGITYDGKMCGDKRVHGEAKNGKFAGWKDFPKSWKTVAKRQMKAQQKQQLIQEVRQHLIDEQDEWYDTQLDGVVDDWYDDTPMDATDYWDVNPSDEYLPSWYQDGDYRCSDVNCTMCYDHGTSLEKLLNK